MKVSGVISLKVGEGDFFDRWFEFLRPFHHLSYKEMAVAAALVRKRWVLSKDVKDPKVLDMLYMSGDMKKAIRAELGITTSYFNGVMKDLREAGVIVNGKVHPKYIPKLKEGEKDFILMIDFRFED